VNPVTNKIYVASCTIRYPSGPTSGSLTVIDAATNATNIIVIEGCFTDLAVNSVTNKIYAPSAVIDGATDAVTHFPGGIGGRVAVNPVTNKIYVASGSGIINVIDGSTNSITTVTDPNAFSLSAAAIAVNPVTNKIYVANNLYGSSTNPGNLTVIDGGSNSTTTVTDPNAMWPFSVAVNSATNKVYVANLGEGTNHGNVTVIDGATNSIATVTDPNAVLRTLVGREFAVAVNSATNKIYVANADSNNVTVIDGATNATTTVTDPNSGYPIALAVDSVTNMIYVTNSTNPGSVTYPGVVGSVTVINGATDAVTTVIDPKANEPGTVAVNPTTNKIYVANLLSNNTTVIDGGTAASSHLLFIELAGTGTGTVASNPAGINCGTSCLATFASGTLVNLTASPASESRLSGWGAACAGTNACDLTMTSDEFVLANFGRASDFSIQSASAGLTAQRGGQVTDVITIAPLSGGSFDSPIQLTCGAVNPTIASPTCALSPSSVTPGASSVTSTLTITASTQSAALIPSKSRVSSSLYAGLVPIPLALIGFGLASAKSKQPRRQLWLLCSLFLAFVALEAGCGGGSSGQLVQPQPQNYVVIVTATSGSIQHTTQVTVTVQ
jgi:YVTN family beta-propeller protein